LKDHFEQRARYLFYFWTIQKFRMSTLDKIKLPVAEDVSKFEHFFKETIQTETTFLNLIINYVIRSKGKQVRPLFVFLSAKMFGEINRRTYLAASTIEILHSASLIHDDVVDESYERRGMFSINALWKNKIAVLTGDYMLAKGMLIATQEKEYEMLEIISLAVEEMVEGELIQLNKSRKLDIDEETYIELIKKKTATLIGISMSIGAYSVNCDPDSVKKMREIGTLVGLAFQIRDDIFDYQDKGIIGKPTGNDLKEKKITLPLIYVLKNASFIEKTKILNVIRRKSNQKEKVNELIELVRLKGGIDYATEKMNFYASEAQKKLNEFPESEARSALSQLIDYVITRKK